MDYRISLLSECNEVSEAAKRVDVPQIPKLPLYFFTGDSYVNPQQIKEGHILFMQSQNFFDNERYVRIMVTHIYKKWVFYEILEGFAKATEDFILSDSDLFKKFVFPVIVEVPQGWKEGIKSPCRRIKYIEC